MQDVFSKIANASATKGGNNLRDGKYRFVIERVQLHTGHTGTCIIPELRVVKADRTEKDVEPNAVGSTTSCVWNLSQHDSAPGNVKAFVLAVLGLDEASTPPAKMQELSATMVSEGQPFRGIEIDVTTMRRVNQGRKNAANRGQIMVLPNWQHVQGQTRESIASNRTMLDTGTVPAAAAQAPATPVTPPTPPATSPQSGGSILGGLFK